MDATVDEVKRLLDLADHPSTPGRVRRKLAPLRAEAHASSKRAFERFEEIASPALAALSTEVPRTTLCRVQSLPTFLRHCAKPSYQALDAETFRRQVEGSATPDALLTALIDRDAVVFPRRRSWMVPGSEQLRAASGAELVRMLKLERQHPPFALCVMPQEWLAAAGVEIRTPTAADAALAGHGNWRPDILAAGPEYIDLDVPGSAVQEVLWRP